MNRKVKMSLCVVIVACLVLLCPMCSFAENENENVFLIHNGTQFGMSIDEVIECETKAGFQIEENPSTHRYSDFYGLIGTGKVAGKDGVKIYYTFNEDEQLIQADYHFRDETIFNTIEKALTEKYGETEYSYTTQKSYDELNIGAHEYVFDDDKSNPYTQRIITVSDSLVVAIDHRVGGMLGPEDIIVYTALSMGEANTLNSEEMNDL